MNEQEAKEIVLEWLKEIDYTFGSPVLSITSLGLEYHGGTLPENVGNAFLDLPRKEEYELLAEFAAWGLKEGAKG
ncbi:hypothetical protein [Listeria ivanovii]|uniref:hypothetical protein n=1 Tax=Listeria ivanovii TaxID=1638 RepID=UPI0019421B29|nr:hypothetical protein [Listeria ivanovii]MBM5707764.1 hypothetical protein [Listeria ivanovii]